MVAAPELKAGWLTTRWDRLNGPQRIAGIDLARGLAVLGMFAAHLLVIGPLVWTDAATWLGIVDGRSSILFATLAGVSIGLVTGGPRPITGAAMTTARMRLAVRAGLLFMLGLVLMATGVPVFVILPAYGVLFLLALPFASLPARVLLPLAAGWALVMPFVQVLLENLPLWRTPEGELVGLLVGWHYPFTVWLAFVIAGLGVARAGVTRARTQLLMLGIGATLAAIAYGADAAATAGADATVVAASVGEAFWNAVWTAEPHSSGVLEVVGSGGFALAVIGLCLLLCRTFLKWVLLPLRAVGAMPLTAYTAQLLSWAIVAAAVLGDTRDLGGFRDLQPFWPLTVWTIVGCTAWALLIGRGPLEWVFDRLSRIIAPGVVGRVDR